MELVKKKVILLGEGAVGKSSLIRRFVTGAFDDRYLVTIGTNNSKKTLKFGETTLDMTIWDLMGQHINPRILQSYMRGANGAILVCDLRRADTVAQLAPHWAAEVKKAAPGIPVVVAGNKKDLVETNPAEFSEVQPQLAAQGFKVAGLFTTSAKTGENVEQAFQALGKALLT
jgi:small GTP-binding protein